MEDGDDYYEKDGVYINGNRKMAFATANLGNDHIKVITTGIDRATRDFMNDNFNTRNVLTGISFLVYENVMKDFIESVFDKDVEWEIENKNGVKVTIPGTWMSEEKYETLAEPAERAESAGGSRKKNKKSRKSKKRKNRKSKKRRR